MIKLFTTDINCHGGDVRLVNGSGRHEGRIEVCFNETWGTICDSSYRLSLNIPADVICQQLGYFGAGIILFSSRTLSHTLLCIIERSTFGFGRGSLPILAKYVYCRGYESNIGECTYSTTGLSDCFHYGGDIVGVQCISSSSFVLCSVCVQLRVFQIMHILQT